MNFRSPESPDPWTISNPSCKLTVLIARPLPSQGSSEPPPSSPPPHFLSTPHSTQASSLVFSHIPVFPLLSSEHQSSLSLTAYSKYTSQYKPRKYGYKKVISVEISFRKIRQRLSSNNNNPKELLN